MTYLLKYYVSAFTNTKSDHTLSIWYNNFTRWDAVLRHAQDIVWQFTLLHIAQCHDKKSEYWQIFFPCTGSGQQYAHRQETIDTTVLSPHGIWHLDPHNPPSLRLSISSMVFLVACSHGSNRAVPALGSSLASSCLCAQNRKAVSFWLPLMY